MPISQSALRTSAMTTWGERWVSALLSSAPTWKRSLLSTNACVGTGEGAGLEVVDGTETVVARVSIVAWLKSLCAPDADREDGTEPAVCSSELVTTTDGCAAGAGGLRAGEGGTGVVEPSRVLGAAVEVAGSGLVEDGRRWRSKSVWNGTTCSPLGPLRRNQSMTCFALPDGVPPFDCALPQVASNSGLAVAERGGIGRVVVETAGGRGDGIAVVVVGRAVGLAGVWVIVLERVREGDGTESSLGAFASLAAAGARLKPPMLSAFWRRLLRRLFVTSSSAFSSATRFASAAALPCAALVAALA